MRSFTTLNGLAAPMDRPNVDTDLIIPKQFLKSIQRTGFGANLFDELRYLDKGEPGETIAIAPLTQISLLTLKGTKGLLFCLHVRTLVAVQAVNTRLGR